MEKKIKQREGLVLFMKGGGHKWFSKQVVEMGTPQRNGWVEVGNVDAIGEIETEKIEIQKVEIPDEDTKEDPEVDVKEESKEYPSDDEIREYLKGLADEGKIRKVHPKTGQAKLRKLYDENTK